MGTGDRKGQLSVFLAVALLVSLSMAALVVNVGLFVKAKINLQNAVDAAAWSGAAVQARQLTNIAYVNYEFRQIFKEWLFKYYILGNLGGSTAGNRFLLARPAGEQTNFRKFNPAELIRGPLGGIKPDIVDKYNLPTVCVTPPIKDPNSKNPVNLCDIISTAGFPRFTPVDLGDITTQQKIHIDIMEQKVAEDCSKRTALNFATAFNWTFGSGRDHTGGAFSVLGAGGKPGAWIQALLAAVRMRNLESIVNRLPVENIRLEGLSVTSDEGVIGTGGGSDTPPFDERPVKAFWSAFRNLSGGNKKVGDDELARGFTLTELAPVAEKADPGSLSGFLIPDKQISLPNGHPFNPLDKGYLDLQILPVNYMIFYTMFQAGESQDPTPPTSTQDIVNRWGAMCLSMKMGLPVPAYITGFAKNPEVPTYYSVKGESRFMGLFFPFWRLLGENGIHIQAYASAKPFGGRIGPWLFEPGDSPSTLKPRIPEPRSLAYLSTILEDPGGVPMEAGSTFPKEPDFYAKGNDVVGGVPDDNTDPAYVVPNMIYDFDRRIDSIEGSGEGGIPILHLELAGPSTTAPPPTEGKVGLYDWRQFESLRDTTLNLAARSGSFHFTSDEIQKAIDDARTPTNYEAANWMVPLPPTLTSPSNATMKDQNGIERVELYAPLFGPGTLYRNQIDIINAVGDYLRANHKSFDKYLRTLAEASHDIIDHNKTTTTTAATPPDYTPAANYLFRGNARPPRGFSGPIMDSSRLRTCPRPGEELSLADMTYHLFKDEDSDACGVKSMLMGLREAIDDPRRNDRNYLRSPYPHPDSSDVPLFSTAYHPRPEHGGTDNGSGEWNNRLRQVPPRTRKRNYYSTKFIGTEKVREDSEMFYDSERYNIYAENPRADTYGKFDTIRAKNALNIFELENFQDPNGTLHH